MLFKRSFLYVSIVLTMLLAACSGVSTEEKIYEHLEEAVDLEAGFAEQQSEIKDLEQEEQDIFNKIIDLTMDEFDEIEKLADQAKKVISERVKKIELETESIDASKNEFEKVKELIAKLEDEKVKAKAEEMYDVMIKRYDAYDKIKKAYIQSLEAEEKLYTLFQDKEVEQDDITEQTQTVNENYEDVLEGNEAFNTATVEFNEKKKEFYDLAELNVSYEEA